jgi:hypothetical protein
MMAQYDYPQLRIYKTSTTEEEIVATSKIEGYWAGGRGNKISIARGQDAMGDDGGMTERVMVGKPIHFVLVHGISGGAWCWYKIRCLMENSGYRVSCIDLKSSGIDQTDPTSLVSFDDYNKPLMDFMSNLPDNEQVVLLNCLH